MKSFVLSLCVFGLVACGSEADPKPVEKDTGREETKKVEALDAVGYDGSAIRKSIDKTLDKQDERNKELEEAQNLNK